MVNNRLWGHPAWAQNVDRLTEAGVRWLSIHDGTIGDPSRCSPAQGTSVVKRFDPGWITAQLRL